MKITYTEVEQNLRDLSQNINNESYIYDFLSCFGTAKATITRLKNKFSSTDELVSNGQLHFKYAESNLEQQLKELSSSKSLKKDKIRFIIVTDYKTIFAYDLNTNETIEILIDEVHFEFEFFLPIAGIQIKPLPNESEADVKAAIKLAKLFDLLKVDNKTETEDEVHFMNVFLSRILFCFFAEDTGIYEKDQFTNSVNAQTQDDGSDVHIFINELFKVLSSNVRNGQSNNLISFPYVNGGLFSDSITIPVFNTRSRRALLECGSLDWSKINPDIFGSMIQAVVDTKYRADMGMHYTSVTNIMKVLDPLFLSKLVQSYLNILATDFKAETKIKNLKILCARLSNIKIADMACGSGNFLIIAYKELRQLEIKILQDIKRLEYSDEQSYAFANNQSSLLVDAPQSGISLKQFYGIEYDDFAASIAELSLWLAEHQMNQKFNNEFEANEATLPLKSFNNIIQGNALRLDWKELIPNNGEIYIVGNPPFYGSSNQTKEQKEDMATVFHGVKSYKKLDYVAAWFRKGANYIKDSEAKIALISTNSLCQGEQVGIFWKNVIEMNIEIDFAHTSFKWANSARDKAGVTCIVVGLRNINKEDKFILSGDLITKVKNINAYLTDAPNQFVSGEKNPISIGVPLVKGNQPTDGGNLILSTENKNELIEAYPDAAKFIKKYIGADELIYGKVRWCLWISESEFKEASEIPEIMNRINKVKEMRLKSTKKATRKLAEKAYAFDENRYKNQGALFIPSHSSENRDYIPMDFFDKNTISSNANFVSYNCPKYIFSLLSSKLHVLWVRTVGGNLETRLRYSNTLCYNTFPIPNLSDLDIEILEEFANRIIKARMIDGRDLSKLYDSKLMPMELKEAHQELDLFIDSLYQKHSNKQKKVKNDLDRLEGLFKMYADVKEAS